MKKTNLKSLFAALAVSAVAVSATSVAASASDYSKSITDAHNNAEVAYDGSAYVTTLDPSTAATKAQIIIDKDVSIHAPSREAASDNDGTDAEIQS